MSINKIRDSVHEAVADVPDGATVMIGGFGTAGLPNALTEALIAQGARDLTIVNNNAGNGDTGLAALLAAKRVRKIICSFPRQADSHHFDGLYRSGQIEFGTEAPEGTIVIARGKANDVRREITATARLAYDGKTLLVPGVPGAPTSRAAGDALAAHLRWLRRRESKTFRVTRPQP